MSIVVVCVCVSVCVCVCVCVCVLQDIFNIAINARMILMLLHPNVVNISVYHYL